MTKLDNSWLTDKEIRYLERLEYNLYQCFSRDNINADIGFERYPEIVAERIAAKIRVHILGEKVGKRTISYPRDWWQAFKDRWFPVWAKKRYPVIFTVKDVSFTATFPEYRVPDGFGNVAYMETVTTYEREYKNKWDCDGE